MITFNTKDILFLVKIPIKNNMIGYNNTKNNFKIISLNISSEMKNNPRKQHYVIFAKSFSKMTKDARCFDLKDIEKAMKQYKTD